MAQKSRIPQIIVLGQAQFDEYCHENGYVDETVEKDDTKAFISIVNTETCLKNYMEDFETKHWFETNHSNVFNVDFDDISRDSFEWHGYTILGMSDQQASDMVDFIERNMEGEVRKDFIIHCRAGVSRSQAVGMFLWDYYGDYFYDNTKWLETSYEHVGYNKHVYYKLKKAYLKKHGYEE